MWAAARGSAACAGRACSPLLKCTFPISAGFCADRHLRTLRWPARKRLPQLTVADVFITEELDRRAPKKTDYLQEKLALQDVAARMADQPEEVLPRFVDLALEMTGGVSAGLSLYEESPPPGVFRWQYLRGRACPV